MLSGRGLSEWVSTVIIVCAAMMLVMMLAFGVPVFGAVEKDPNQNFGGNPTSAEHRANASGQGNFGQCHPTGGVQGQESSTLNPSSQNAGEADCRQAGGTTVVVVANCPGSVDQYAEAQIIFQPERGATANSGCEF